MGRAGHSCLVTHLRGAQVLEAAVIAVPHPKWDERPLLIVVPHPAGPPPTPEDVLAFMQVGTS